VRVAIASVLVALAACGSATIGGPPNPGDDPDASVAEVAPDAGPPAPDARVCAAGDQNIQDPATGHCLSFFEGVATWLEARNLCIALGGDLATPTTAVTNNLLWPLATNLLSEPDAWIGGSDSATEGTFVWVSGDPFVYTNFRAGEPNNGGTSGTQEDCLVIEDDTAGTWDDRPCSRAYPYFCDIP
jgi:hypothetical protein